jgi:hypothetical protein
MAYSLNAPQGAIEFIKQLEVLALQSYCCFRNLLKKQLGFSLGFD